MPSQPDLYAILGVSRDAPDEEIKKEYRRKARQYHPDVNKEKGAEEKFKEVSAAFEVLGDATKRKLYDEFGYDGLRPGFNAEAARRYRRQAGPIPRSPGAPGAPGPSATPGSGGFDFSDLLKDLFQNTPAAPPPPPPRKKRGADIEREIEVSMTEAAGGTERDLNLNKPVRCDACHGEGTAAGAKPRTCAKCKGGGKVRGAQGQQLPCDACKGAGQLPAPPCPTCNGTGEVGKQQKLRVKIPAGVDEGSRVRLAGQGGPGSAGGENGDLFLTVRLRPHPLLRRDGTDLVLDLPLTVREAMEGTEVDVPTLTGPIRLRVPPGTDGGRKLRLRGKGMASKEGPPGDLFVVVQVRLPPATDTAREAARKLDGAYDSPPRAAWNL